MDRSIDQPLRGGAKLHRRSAGSCQGESLWFLTGSHESPDAEVRSPDNRRFKDSGGRTSDRSPLAFPFNNSFSLSTWEAPIATYQILYWDEIPVGVKATRDGRRGRVRRHLSNRFQLAVDSVATITGRSDEESYMAGWSWGDPVTEPGTPTEVAERVIGRLESEYPSRRLSDLRRSIIASHRAQQKET